MDNKDGNKPEKRSEDYTAISGEIDGSSAPSAQQTPVTDGNISVRFNEPQKEFPAPDIYKADQSGLSKREISIFLQLGIVLLAATVVFLLVRHISKEIKFQETSAVTTQPVSVIPTTIAPTTVPASTVAPTTDKNTSSKVTSTTKSQVSTTISDTQDTTVPITESDSTYENLKEKEEIIAYFNESSNRVKSEAVKAVKNFEKRSINRDKFELPSAIKNVALGILENKFTDITEPVEYPYQEAIVARYPVPGQEWSSKLSAEDVADAVCVENGDEYEITITLNTCTDPEPGKGISKAVDCLDVPTIRDTAPPFITDFSAEYYDCVIRCRVEKKTGRILWSDYITPVVLKIGFDAGFVEFDAQIGITFEKDYTITY